MIVALLAGLMAFALITRRLTRLERAMTRFRDDGFQGHRQVSVPDRPVRDEIDQLAHTFDEMAERLAAQLRELEKTDRLRRELVTNISHDLRTPADFPARVSGNSESQARHDLGDRTGSAMSIPLSGKATG